MLDLASINKYNSNMTWKMKFKLKAWWRNWCIAIELFLVMLGFALMASLDTILAQWL